MNENFFNETIRTVLILFFNIFEEERDDGRRLYVNKSYQIVRAALNCDGHFRLVSKFRFLLGTDESFVLNVLFSRISGTGNVDDAVLKLVGCVRYELAILNAIKEFDKTQDKSEFKNNLESQSISMSDLKVAAMSIILYDRLPILEKTILISRGIYLFKKETISFFSKLCQIEEVKPDMIKSYKCRVEGRLDDVDDFINIFGKKKKQRDIQGRKANKKTLKKKKKQDDFEDESNSEVDEQ